MTRFIGFAGKKQRGKNAAALIAADILREQGYTVAEYAYAQTLKDMCINVFGLDSNLVYGTNDDKETPCHVMWDGFPDSIRNKYATAYELNPVAKDLGPPTPTKLPVMRTGPMSVRELLQVMGTDIFRERVYSEVWAEAPFRQDWEGIDYVLLTDVRFPNEVTAVEDHGGQVLRMERSVTGLDSDNHPSETALDDYEFRFSYSNDGTMEELANAIRAFLQFSCLDFTPET